MLGEGWGALASADAMLVSLGEVQTVLDSRVNATGGLAVHSGSQSGARAQAAGHLAAAFANASSAPQQPAASRPNPRADIAAQLQCLAPLLDALPPPAALAADISAANASVDSVLRPALSDLSTQLGGLAERLDPGVAGAYAGALQTAAGGQALLLDAPDGLVPRANVSEQWGGKPAGKEEGPKPLQCMLLPLLDTLLFLRLHFRPSRRQPERWGQQRTRSS